MFTPDVTAFLQQPRFMDLGTLRKDGSIQMSVVWYEFDGSVFKVSTTKQRAKYKNVTRDPRVTFIIINNENPYQFVQVEGTTTVTEEGGHELIDHLSELYTGKTPYAGDPEHKEDRVVLTITPTRVVPHGFS